MSFICIRIRNSFPFKWLCTGTRFETEACSNSEMGYCFGFALLHSVIGLKFSRHFFNQSEVKPKPIVACACTFPRSLCRLHVITSSFDWLLDCLRPFWLAKVITFVWFDDTRLKLALMKLINNYSISARWIRVGHPTRENRITVTIKFSILDIAFLAFWLAHAISVISSYTDMTFYGKWLRRSFCRNWDNILSFCKYNSA